MSVFSFVKSFMNRWKGLRDTLSQNPKLTKFLKVQNASESLLTVAAPKTRREALNKRAELSLLIEEVEKLAPDLSTNEQFPDLLRKLRLKLSETQNLLESTLTPAAFNLADFAEESEDEVSRDKIPQCPLSATLHNRISTLHPSRYFAECNVASLETSRAKLVLPCSTEKAGRAILGDFAIASKELRDAVSLGLDCLCDTKLQTAEAQLFLVTSKQAVEEQSILISKKIKQVASISTNADEGLAHALAGVLATSRLADDEVCPLAEELLASSLGYVETLKNLDFESAEQALVDWENYLRFVFTL